MSRVPLSGWGRWCGLLLVLLAAACTGASEPTATLLPSLAPPSSAAAAGTTTPVPPATAIPQASATRAAATNVARPSATLGDPLTATASISEATPNATAQIATVIAYSTPQSLATLASPDGQWTAAALRSDCTPMGGDSLAYEQLVLHGAAGGEPRVLADQLLNCGGLGASGLEPLYWSSDSRYLFYTTARGGSPDGGGCGPWYRPIVRADIQSGEKVELAEGVPSPDGTLTAGYQFQEVIVWGRDVNEVVRATTAEPAGSFGPLAWAPDGKALVYLRWDAGCPQSGGNSVLIRLDLPSGAQTVLNTSSAPIFADVAWETPGELHLTDADGQAWLYDLATNTLTQAPA